MTGTQVFVLAIILIAAFFALLFSALIRRTPGKAKLSFGDLFGVEIDLGAADKDKAKEAINAAIKDRGSDTDDEQRQVDDARKQIDQVRLMRVARVLWVDDSPDNNLQETIALERLGLFVTKATTTQAAVGYLQHLEFALVLTDVARGKNPNAGLELLERVKHIRKEVPVIVYTMSAVAKLAELTEAGARAVVDTPSELIAAVLASLT